MDMDFLFYDVKRSERLAADNTIQSFFSRGYIMLVDKIDFTGAIERNKPSEKVEEV
jgi:predicted O-methyltransferase YrrM